mgnify:CR=1 FL=1
MTGFTAKLNSEAMPLTEIKKEKTCQNQYNELFTFFHDGFSLSIYVPPLRIKTLHLKGLVAMDLSGYQLAAR